MEGKVDEVLFGGSVQHEIDQRFRQQAVTVAYLSHCLVHVGQSYDISTCMVFWQHIPTICTDIHLSSSNMLIQVFFAG